MPNETDEHALSQRARLEQALYHLIQILNDTGHDPKRFTAQDLIAFLRTQNQGITNTELHIKKKQLLPVYLDLKAHHPNVLASWNITKDTEARLIQLLQMKPRRTASGVATITVLTKPWPCSGTCSFCPNDIRMPKSYLSKEPACQRAEKNYFDPYLQVISRLQVLNAMGHPTDKIELIVLGGSFTEYPEDYQRWYVKNLFDALNDGIGALSSKKQAEIASSYEQAGQSCDAHEIAQSVSSLQARINSGELTYNQAWNMHYAARDTSNQAANLNELREALTKNAHAPARCVGLSFETHPQDVTTHSLTLLRSYGATKIQIGVQTTRDDVLSAATRSSKQAHIIDALKLLRLFGFKIQTHFMHNLPGASPQEELTDYRTFITHPNYLPDEIKLYPLSLIAGTELERRYQEGKFHPYSTNQLVELLAEDLIATPPYIRVDRVIRDFSAEDIVAGNKKGNLRQQVDEAILARGKSTSEIRTSEIALSDTRLNELKLSDYRYTTNCSQEHFLSFRDSSGALHGFLRLSLPTPHMISDNMVPLNQNEAMIRELHIYGRTARLGNKGSASQHRGLGTRLIHEAERIAKDAQRDWLYVISAAGTVSYYEQRGFTTQGLYQVKDIRTRQNQQCAGTE